MAVPFASLVETGVRGANLADLCAEVASNWAERWVDGGHLAC